MLSKKQKQILAFPYTHYDALICDGAIRSGKTSIMTLSFIDDAMRRYNGQRFGICGKTVGSAIANIIQPYVGLSYANNKYHIKWKQNEKLLIVSYGNVTNAFEVFGGKDKSSYMLIQGRTLAGVLFDEVALQDETFVKQATARCSVKGSKFWFNCNPESPNHWFYKEWLQQLEKHNAFHIHFLLTDNPSLDDETISRYYAMYSGVFYNRYILGEWCQAEGLIYKTFIENKNRFMIKFEDVPKDELRYINIGQDFGGNKSKHTFNATAITADFSTVYVLASRSYPAKDTTVEFVVRKLDEFCKEIENRYGFVDFVFSDSAEQAIINSQRANTNWHIRDSVKREIIDRIRATDILMTSDRIKFVEADCESIISALQTATWDEEATKDTRLDIPGTTDIDPLDAFEYSWEYWLDTLIR